ncbi:type VI secretion system protein ImpL [Tamilnaduibacter salinus]|uniref:Type VI secretion system protein ImpL n=1 Tax=Tamilnaduibacter salinus TaxID=1484056 RepID=A0A2U1CYW5_9GAMM|nr:type VI secretion system membrane subunit TssM [Tamilnaduibacter salinus]PVY77669.1 type VI secretion system protein ImpL [Tamilnaduibacter salinus]
MNIPTTTPTMPTFVRQFLMLGKKVWPFLKMAGKLVFWLGLVAALGALWWFGPMWEWDGSHPLASWESRALITLGVVFLILLIWGLILARRLKSVNRERAEEEKEQEDPLLAYERRQNRLLDKALLRLRQAIPGRRWRYKLPWYLVIGLEEDGKTSLIQRSGQRFTVSQKRKRATERNPMEFEWWVSDRAVLIDPDGTLISQPAGADEGEGLPERLWGHFLTWLEANRPRRPLNGVVLTVDLSRLASLDDQERQARAVQLRSRLRELMERLGTRLPVYVTFTKMDLLHGFEPFFRKLSEKERQRPLGLTFSPGSVNEPDSWLDEFDDQYEQLMDQLQQHLPTMLADTRENEERAAIYSFTRQMAGLHGVLQRFLGEMLAADAFSTTALVRGVYFTSVYQEGVPEDPYVTAAAHHYGLPSAVQPAQRGRQSRTWFSEQLFSRVIYPEAGLAGDNRRVIRQRRRSLAVAAVLFLAAGLGTTAGWHHFFLQNAEAAERVQTRVQGFLDNWNPVGHETDPTGRNLLEPLDQLREATLAYGNYREQWRWVEDMGLYQGHRVGPEVEAAYLNMLAYQYLPALMIGVMDNMNAAPEGSSERLRHLRVLRMLYDGSGRRDDLVSDYMSDYWQQRYPGQRSVQDRLHKHLDYAMAHTDLATWQQEGDRSADMALMPFQSSVGWAQKRLGRTPTPERVYSDLKEASTDSLSAALNVGQQSGPAFNTVFVRVNDRGQAMDESPAPEQDPLRIHRMLTREGLQRYFLRRSESVTELALVDAWVLGRRDDVDFSDADEQALRAQLRDRYVRDYTAQWRRAISHLDVRRFRDLNHGVRVLDNLTGGHQPLTELLTTLRMNTDLFPDTPGDQQLPEEALEESPRYRLAQRIAGQFEELHALTEKPDEKTPSTLEDILQVSRNLHDYLRAIQEAPNTGKAALEAARARLTMKGDDPIFTLQRLARNQPEPINRMLEKLAAESWRVVLNQAVAQLERKWYREVYQPFQQKLARHYPFQPDAGRDAGLKDFESFFGPDGTLNRFYEQHLKLFLEDHPEHVALSQRATLVRRDVMQALRQAEKIREAYFARSGGLDVEFALEPLNLTANKRRSVMNVDGQLVEFSHGPRQSIPLIWPNTLRESVQSRVTLVPATLNRSPRSKIARGPWAFFRLLDKAEVNGVSASAVDITFRLDDGEVQYRLHAAGNTNPFTQQLLADYSLPGSLY